MEKLPYRVGCSYDVHRLTSGDSLYFGGVEVFCHFRAVAHSDGDVLLHAISEAILGSLGLGDLGTFFPDTDEKTKGMSSSLILKFAVSKAKEKGYRIGNIDSSIIAERPKLNTYIPSIRRSIAELANMDVEDVSVKAGTNEGIDAIGHQEAIGAFATVLLIRE